jgi:hypothetical protein
MVASDEAVLASGDTSGKVVELEGTKQQDARDPEPVPRM